MSRLIQKSGFIKPGRAAGYMKYIATRERVEKQEGSGPATENQKKLIARLLKDFPDAQDLFEYEDYLAAPTAANASAFLTMALDAHANETLDRIGYLRYMGTRPRAERHGEHGLFSNAASVSMDAALKEVEAHTGNVWTLIYSLRRADAAHLGYDHTEGWRTLLKGKQAELAAALKIQPDHLHWYAAFHDEGEHPHIHVMAWSSDPKEGFLTKDALLDFRSKLTNEIFRGELQELYVRKNVSYKAVTAAAREEMAKLVKQLDRALIDNPGIEAQMLALARSLERVKGKRVYGYLKKPLKAQVDGIVDALSELPEVAACYAAWNKLKDELDGYYREQPREHLPLSQQKEFRAIKNMVIHEAENLRLDAQTFEDEALDEQDEDGEPELPEESAEPEADKHDTEAQQQEAEPDGGAGKQKQRTVWQQAQEYREAKAVLANRESTAEEKTAAVQTLERLWGEGFTVAAHQLGKVWRDGLCDLPDMNAAAEWFRRSAAAGNDYSQYALGRLLQEQNRLAEAVPWLERAAANGNQYAQYRLAKLYLTGDGVAKDAEKAVELLTASATKGNQWAQYLLGKLLLQGKQVERDVEAATDWLKRSADQGNKYAQFFLDHLDNWRDPSLLLCVVRLLRDVGSVFRNTPPPANPAGFHVESKRRRRILQKRLALGHKADDHADALNNKYQHTTHSM